MKERKPYDRHVNKKSIGWYILWEGRQVRLGRFKQEAHENWKRLKAGQPIDIPRKATKQTSEPTVRDIVDIYLDHQQSHGSPNTYLWYKNYLRSLCDYDSLGTLKVSALKNHMVQSWIDTGRRRDKRPWGDNAAHAAARAVIAAFNHAVEFDHLKESPVAKFKKPGAVAREDAELSPDEWKRVIAEITEPCLRDAVMFMRLTGARPMECRIAEKRHIKGNTLTFPRLESKGRKRERVIWLNDEALEIVQRLAALNPEGKLFRNKAGNDWDKSTFARRFSRLSVKLKIPHLIPYSLRYTFATESVLAGLDSIVLAKLMGHSSTKMLEKVYAKHARRDDFMTEQLNRAVAGV